MTMLIELNQDELEWILKAMVMANMEEVFLYDKLHEILEDMSDDD